jgi:hypothetical protein
MWFSVRTIYASDLAISTLATFMAILLSASVSFSTASELEEAGFLLPNALSLVAKVFSSQLLRFRPSSLQSRPSPPFPFS